MQAQAALYETPSDKRLVVDTPQDLPACVEQALVDLQTRPASASA